MMNYHDKIDHISDWATSHNMYSDTGRVFPFVKATEYVAERWEDGIDLLNTNPDDYLGAVMKTLFERGKMIGRNEIRRSFTDLMEIETE